MNLGLGNLIELKRQLLGADMISRPTWDEKIAALGKGVARLLERYCNRRFERTVDALDIFSADRASWILQRFPVEVVTAIDQKDAATDGYQSLGAVNEVVINYDAQTGRVDFGNVLGSHTGWVRITYTGGYWFDTSEDGSGVMPVGATALEDDIKLAWTLQCQKVWQVADPLGQNIVKGSGEGQLLGLSLAGLELIPQVKQILAPHVRYQIT